MAIRISGPGVGLQLPQYLYPTELANAPNDLSSNYQALAPGDALAIPAGEWLINVGAAAFLQYLDPVTGIWRNQDAFRGQAIYIRSDGFTTRAANLTGCPIAAIVTNGGSGYAQASTTVTATSGGSTWQPIVGGQATVVTVSNVGANYGLQPMVFVPAPPNPGVQATAIANISAGTVSGVTLTNVGAGYITAPTAAILPNPTDPNYTTISQAAVTFGLTSAGKITAVLCTNNGAPVTTAPTLSVGGAGTAATVSAVLLQTVQSASITGAGIGYGTTAEISTVGGVPSAGAYVNPAIEATNFRPRKASIGTTLTAGSLTAVGTIYDGGLFAVGNAPGVFVNSNGIPTAAATVVLTLGSTNTTIMMQPL